MSEEKKIETEQQPATQKFEWKRMLNYKWIEKNIPFFLFLAVLAVLYIYNGHYADKMVRKISTTEKHIKELEYEYKTIKSDVIFRSKASELAKAVEPLGLKELITPPVLIGASSQPKTGASGR
jgi:hypothetical protein